MSAPMIAHRLVRRIRRLCRRLVLALIVGGGAGLAVVGLSLALVRSVDPPLTAVMVERAWRGARLDQRLVTLNAISPNLVHAVIAAEDARFCAHRGVDWAAVRQAWSERAEGRFRGGSTLSQQTVKNVFLWNGGGWFRKGLEAGLTVIVDPFWGKRRVLEIYLNLAEWGDGLFGAEAAAQARFGKPAAALSADEAALLAAVLPNPNARRLDPPNPQTRAYARTIQARMAIVRRDGLAACVFD
ncbi:MAG: monofunctional biosynthetic peptidoglycan transglycosylase [Maricaulaceae bacterium]